jgi:hypothetical protein
MAKESWTKGGDTRPSPGVETSFDNLAKGLASGTVSRRQALTWMGSALLGGVLASIPGVAWTQQVATSNDACVEFCKSTYPGHRKSAACISQGAQGHGPCYSCNPGLGPGPHFVPPECPGGTFNLEICECECPPNMALHHLSGRCVSTVCQAEDDQRCAENPPPDTHCCPAYLESGEPTGFACCPPDWLCDVNHGETGSICTPP